jgi:hypothetical protein
MHMRVTHTRTDPAKWDENLPEALEAIEAIRQLPGNQSIVVVGDRTRPTGERLFVSTWDTEDHARFSREAVLGDLLARVQGVGIQVDPPQIFEGLG